MVDVMIEESSVNVLGVRVNNLCWSEILKKVEIFLAEPKFHQIATVNPEFILEAKRNPEFKNILNACDLNVADGIGIEFAFLRYGKFLKSRLAGADLMLEILKLAEKKKLSVFLATRENGLSSWQETREKILKIHPKLSIDGAKYEILSKNSTAIQPYMAAGGDREGANEVKGDKLPAADIVFCNFGAPHQEVFINSLKSDKIRLAMGVGGSFDYLTGKAKRAPLFLRRLGLEWLWRLILQPWRIKRIFNAVIIFSIKIILWKEK